MAHLVGLDQACPLEEVMAALTGYLLYGFQQTTFWLEQRVECQFTYRARYHVSTMLMSHLIVKFDYKIYFQSHNVK
jgi:hypothetical protein